MKEFKTITEYQLLFLARKELTKRINEVKDGLIKGKLSQSKRRTENLLKMYCEQLSEIIERMAEINYEEE